jgi:hypothetical protein
MRLRLAAVTAAAALAAVALPGHAAAPQITDPSGDALLPSAGLDIVSALFSTDGKTVVVGKKKTYVPKVLKVTVTYADAADTSDLASQAVMFDVAGCGAVLLQRYSGGTWSTADCTGDESPGFDAVAVGRTIVFTLPFSSLGKQVKRGTGLTNLRTWAGLAEPVAGFGPADVSENAVVDYASTAKPYRIA